MIIGPITDFTPRSYQHHCIYGGDPRRGPGILPLLARYRRLLVAMATGLGKTETFLWLTRIFIESGLIGDGRCALYLSHRDELVLQPIERAHRFGMAIGREQGDDSCVSSPLRVISSTIQTMRIRKDLYDPARIGLVIIDECHHAAADDYQEVLEYFAGAIVIGFTATPNRHDGIGLGEVFEAVAFEYLIDDARAEGWLVPVRAHAVKLDGLDLTTLRPRMGDLPPNELGELLSEFAHPVARDLVTRAGNRPTLVFCVTVAHAFAQAEALRRYTEERVECIYGQTPKKRKAKRAQPGLFDGGGPAIREDIVADFKAGKIRFLVNCAVLTEGFDAPNAACIAMVRPTMSQPLLVQAVGRGTRPLPRIVDAPELRDDPAGRCATIAASAKPDVLALDYTSSVETVGLVNVLEALAGRLTVEERLALHKSEIGSHRTVDEALQEPRILGAELAARAAAEEAERLATSYEVDPFHPVCVLGMKGLRDDPREARASAKQAGFLREQGVASAEKLSASTAQKLIGGIMVRKKFHLCSLKQATALQRAGIPIASTVKMKTEAASALMVELVSNRYVRPPRWDRDPKLGGRE